jgi:hypothetical protein
VPPSYARSVCAQFAQLGARGVSLCSPAVMAGSARAVPALQTTARTHQHPSQHYQRPVPTPLLSVAPRTSLPKLPLSIQATLSQVAAVSAITLRAHPTKTMPSYDVSKPSAANSPACIMRLDGPTHEISTQGRIISSSGTTTFTCWTVPVPLHRPLPQFCL